MIKYYGRFIRIMSALLLGAMLLGACSIKTESDKKGDKKDEGTTGSDTTYSPESSDTTAPADTTTVPIDTTAPIDTTTAPDDIPDEPEVYVPAETGVNPLTGLKTNVSFEDRRPVAIMINNVRFKLNGIPTLTAQRGISNADIMYECVVEGGVTRLMMVVSDWENLPEIGTIRSCREYYLDFASNHDAIYVHAGGSDEAYRQINKVRYTDNLDFVNAVKGKVRLDAYCYRDQELRSIGYPMEHTLMTDGAKIAAGIERLKYRTALNGSFNSPLDFVEMGKERIPEDGTATYLKVRYSGTCQPYYTYDAAKGVYLRYQYDTAHIDQSDGKQLEFENIVLLYCDTHALNDEKKHQSVTTTGSGTGYYLSNGGYEEITWTKASSGSPVKLYNKDGEPLLVNRGKTFFQIVESGNESYTVIK